MNKIRNKKEIKDSILRGLNEALEFVKGARKSSDFRVHNSELNEKRKDGLPLKPRNSKKIIQSSSSTADTKNLE